MNKRSHSHSYSVFVSWLLLKWDFSLVICNSKIPHTYHLWTNISQMTRRANLTIVRTGCQTVHLKSEIYSLTREFLRKIHHFHGYLSGWIVLIIIKVKFSQLWLDRSGQPVLSKGKHAAYVASVSVWFRSKGLGTRMKDCTKNGMSKREGRGCKSCSSMFISFSCLQNHTETLVMQSRKHVP